MSEKLPNKAEQTKSDCQGNCKEFNIEKFYLVLDGEASTEDTQLLKSHIDKCYPCYQHYDLEVAIKKILQDKISKKCMPQDEVQKIKERIAQIV